MHDYGAKELRLTKTFKSTTHNLGEIYIWKKLFSFELIVDTAASSPLQPKGRENKFCHRPPEYITIMSNYLLRHKPYSKKIPESEKFSPILFCTSFFVAIIENVGEENQNWWHFHKWPSSGIKLSVMFSLYNHLGFATAWND